MNLQESSAVQDLANEFRRAPFGHHSPNLQKMLRLFRSQPIAGKHALLSVSPNRRWMLVTLTGDRGRSLIRHEDVTFDSLAEAEWYVFRQRWKQRFGSDLSLEDEI